MVNEGSLSFSNANNYKPLNHLIRQNPQCQIQKFNAFNNLMNIQRMIMGCIRKNEVLQLPKLQIFPVMEITFQVS